MIDLIFYLLISLAINIIIFIPAFIFKTDRLTDISYALTFVVLALISILVNDLNFYKIILFLMVFIWAARLGIFLLIRIKKMKKDSRFDKIRGSFYKFGKFWVIQGLVVFLVLINSILFFKSEGNKIILIGFFIWFIGIMIESIADLQKYKFNQKNKGKFISTGLWKYSRHPNYFGEITCWLGIYIFTLPSLIGISKLVALISPVTIIIILLFITGIPLLEKISEKKWGKSKDYIKYKKSTSLLIPWFKLKQKP